MNRPTHWKKLEKAEGRHKGKNPQRLGAQGWKNEAVIELVGRIDQVLEMMTGGAVGGFTNCVMGGRPVGPVFIGYATDNKKIKKVSKMKLPPVRQGVKSTEQLMPTDLPPGHPGPSAQGYED